MDAECILRVEDIYKSFPGTHALKGVSLEIDKGEIHSLVGENGAGKSTLMNVISGVMRADKGKIILQGKEVHFHGPSDAQNAGIGFVHQELALCPHVSVAENIFIGRLPKKNIIVDRKELYKMTEAVLAPFQSVIRPDQKVSDLSVAQQQVVEIAKALSLNCKLVIFDEPTSSLNEAEAQSLFKIIRDIKSKGISVLYISHKLSEIFEICDRITVLRDGTKISTNKISETSSESIVTEMVGRELGSLYPAKSNKTGDSILDAASFTRKNKFNNVSFHLKEGEILGIGGLVGSGRTEVVRAICGIDPCDKGDIVIHGSRVRFRNYSNALRNGLCYLSEDRKLDGLFLNMNITNNMIAILLDKIAKRMIVPKKQTKSLAIHFQKKLNIKFSDPGQYVSSLSGGNQQKVMIAKLLAINPEIIIMDEPTRGIDVGAKSEIHNMLRELCNAGIGIIVISSELPEIVGLCDRVMVMHEGRMVGELSGNEVTPENIISSISKSRAC